MHFLFGHYLLSVEKFHIFQQRHRLPFSFIYFEKVKFEKNRFRITPVSQGVNSSDGD